MGFIFKGILVVIWLLVVPCLAGGFYFRREKRTCGEYLLAGYTLLFAITELLSRNSHYRGGNRFSLCI